MIVEPLRMLTDWFNGTLKDAAGVDQGILAQLARLPVDPGEQKPGLKAVLDVTRSEDLAAGRVPSGSLPFVAVMLEGPQVADPEVSTIYRDINRFKCSARYVVAATDQKTSFSQALIMLRAIVASYHQFTRSENNQVRVRNLVIVGGSAGVTFGPAYQALEGANQTAAAVFEMTVRDAAP